MARRTKELWFVNYMIPGRKASIVQDREKTTMKYEDQEISSTYCCACRVMKSMRCHQLWREDFLK